MMDLDISHVEAAVMTNGVLEVVPAELYSLISQSRLSVFCVKKGFYCLPTTELIRFLRGEIYATRPIEIGAGNGAVARALGIVATDSYQQERPEIKAIYQSLGQATVPYGNDVIKLNAEESIRAYGPSVIVACFVTQLLKEDIPLDQGNQWGVDEEAIVTSGIKYILVGHDNIHSDKVINKYPHVTYRFPWLYSRCAPKEGNFIRIWNGTK